MRGTELAELNAFATVAEHRSFARAAASLGIAPPTLSHTIRSLEERLGVRLFNRTTRSVALTEAGARLLEHVLPVLDGVDRAIDAVNLFRDKPMGQLRLNMPRPVAVAIIGPIIARFLAEFPEIKVEVSVDETRSDIVSGRFDGGIRIGERIEKDMIALRMVDPFRIIAVAAPDYLAQHPHPKTPDDLRSHSCIRMRWPWDNAIHPWEFERDQQRLNVEVDGSLIVNDIHLMLDAVLDGVGVGYLSEPMVRPYIAEGLLAPVFTDWSGQVSGVFLYYSSRRQIPATLQAFIDFIKQLGLPVPLDRAFFSQAHHLPAQPVQIDRRPIIATGQKSRAKPELLPMRSTGSRS